MAQKLDDIDLIDDEIKELRSGHTRVTNNKKIKVRSSVEKGKDDYRKAKAHNKSEIKKLRNAIKSHKILIRQAKSSYRLIKLNDK